MAATPAKKARPLSPHLGIYRPQISTVMSILHRVTGVGLSFGLIILVAWLVFLAGGLDPYVWFVGLCRTKIGQAILLGISWAFFYHFFCGIRHLIWDAGWCLSLKGMHVTGWIVIFLSTLSVVAIWLKIWGIMP